MLIQVDFGAAQTGVAYRFYDNAGAFVGARVTAGITAGAQGGGVYLKDVTPAAGAVGVYWDCDDAAFFASEDFEQRLAIATNLNATVSSRSSHSAADVWAVTTRTLSSFGTLVADIWANATRTLSAISDSSGVTTLLSRIASALTITAGKVDVNDKTGFALTGGERTAIANEVEAQIIDETDSEKVLTAITDKIASVNPSLGALTLAAIASAVRTELTTELARIDAAISSRSTYAGADTAGTTTLLSRLTAIRSGLLDNLDAAISSRLAGAAYTAPDNADIVTLLARLTAPRAALLDNLANLDAAISSRSTYAGADTSGTTALLVRLSSGRALLLDNLVNLDAAISSISGGEGSGTGPFAVTVHVTDNADPASDLENAIVRLTEGVNAFTAITNAEGEAVFSLSAASYTVAIAKPGYQFTPETLAVTETAAAEFEMTQITIAAPADPDQATGYIVTRDAQGVVLSNVGILFQLRSATGADSYRTEPFEVRSGADGLLTAAFLKGARYRAKRAYQFKLSETDPAWVEFTVGNADSFALPQILGTP